VDQFVYWIKFKVQSAIKDKKRTKVQSRIFHNVSECWIVIQLLKSGKFEF